MKIKNWIKTHPFITIGIVAGIIVIVGLFYFGLTSFLTVRREITHYYPAPAIKESLRAPSILEEVPQAIDVQKEIEVKEGSMELKSKQAEVDFARIESITKEYQGYIERSDKSVTNLYIQINLTLRVPAEKFMNLVQRLKQEFDVKSYQIRNYRVSIEEELDEFQILRKSLSDYEKIREEIKKMEIGKDKIQLLMDLTNKELELKSKERRYQREISSQKRRGEYASLYVSIKQLKSPRIWPENVLNQFKDRLRKAFANVITILKDLVGGGIELFFKVIQIVVYLFIVGVVVAGFYRLTGKLFRDLVRKKKSN